ncbi:LytR C-terminal domain-containing protein [Blastococcus saxobsidens]|uniref:LytR C-terminal domain-containing protein n=1 Tax=Blastococcus saxobsidens TaxID=138336 RepID=UPI00140F697D|nr:LytR C-terminal domain-containing protein [Blastococcus saxobsidens]
MPAAEPRVERPAPVRGADVLTPVSAPHAFGEQPAHLAGKAGVADVMPSRTRVPDEPLATAGPSQDVRTAAPRVPRVPRQTTPGGTPSSSYGDWTKPSRTDETGRSRLGLDAGPELQRVPPAPATSAIPERETAARRDQVAGVDDDLDAHEYYADADHDYDDVELTTGGAAVVAGPGAGPAKRSRATYRAERQVADAARRKAAKRNGTPDVLFEDEPDRKPRRVLKGLVAMAVVAGAVLGVYTVTQPGPTAPAAQAEAAAPPVAPTVAPPTQALPPLNTLPLDVEAAATTPVRVPVTVLNATTITGLAGKISDTVVAGGWESPGAGAYPGTDVAATTVFFTEGDEQQRQAALQLVEQFPDLAGPAPRFFEVADVPAPGLVIVATGNWQP